MKSIILFTLTFIFCTTLFAQNPVQPETEPKETPKEETEMKPVQNDSTPKTPKPIVLKKKVQNPDTNKTNQSDVLKDEVKYYQSTRETRRPSRYRTKIRNRDDIKTLTGKMNHSGGFGALTFKSTEYQNETMILAGLRGGWIINRSLGIGIEAFGIIPTTKYADLNPLPNQDANVLGGYGGMFLEPIFFSNQVVHITFPISAGAGWMGYQEINKSGLTGSDGIISEDVFWYAEPGIALELNIARNFRLNFGVSKRITQDLKLDNTKEDDFNTTNYFLTLKIGGF